MTVVDIARHAKVSPATVSRVINQPDKVTQARVRAVRQAMRALDYTPPPLCNRRGPKSHVLAPKSIAVWFVGAQPSSGINWFQKEVIQMRPSPSMARCPIHLSLFYSETNLEIPHAIQNREVDGVIIQGMEPAPRCWTALKQTPAVWFMTHRSARNPIDFVEPDNQANGELAADYLHANGHARVAVVNADPTYCTNASRTDAFTARCRHHGMKSIVINGESRGGSAFPETHPPEDTVRRLVDRWAGAAPRPSGIYLPADHFCGTFLRAAQAHGLRPETDFDLILGNKSPVIYPNLSHQPTAIDINLPTLVRKAVEQLIWRIDNFDTPGRVGIAVSPTLCPAPALAKSTDTIP